MIIIPHALSPLAIIIMGVSGSGKSTFGQQLATRLSARFLEGDDFHPSNNIEKMRAGIALQDEDRWQWLDCLANAFRSASAESRLVVGTCSALKLMYRNRLRERIPVPVLIICLEADQKILRNRMNSRPGHFMSPSLLDSQFATLEIPGERELALRLDSARPALELFALVDVMLGNLERRDADA